MNPTTDVLIKRALEEWMNALDVVDDPIFIHDHDYRILRCNRSYQQQAGLPFKEIIAHPYYRIFPKMPSPFHHCTQAMESICSDENHEEVEVGEKIFRSRAYVIRDDQNRYLYSVHILEDITRQKKDEERLRDNEAFITAVLDNLPVGISVNSVLPSVAFTYINDNFLKIYRIRREQLGNPDAFWEAVYEDPVFREQIRARVVSDVESGDTERMNWNDIPIERKGSEIVYISARNVPLPSKNAMISMVWDVTERKRSEKRLEEEKTFSETLVQNLPDIFFLIDHEGRLRRWNQKLALLSGIPEPEMKGSLSIGFVHEDDRPLVARKIAEVFERGSSVAEARMLFSNGTRTYALSGRRIEAPGETYLIGFGIDITERKEAETQLKQERDFSERLVDTAPAIILVLDPNGNIIRYNRYMEKLSGYTLKETVGKSWFETFLPEADRKPIRDVFANAVADIQIDGQINPIITKDGTKRQIEWYAKTLKNSAGEITGLLSIGMDVTRRQQTEEALRESEHRFKTIFEKANDGILLADTATKKFTAGNPKICEMLGYPLGELTTLGVADIHPETDLLHVIEEFGKQLRGEIDLASDLPVKRKDGSVFIADINSFPIVIEGHEYLAGFFRDVTRRKHAEAALERANRALRTLSAGNLALVKARSEEELLRRVTDVIIRIGGYDLSAVCYAENDPDKTIRSVISAGNGEEHYCSDMHLSWAENEAGNLPIGRAIRTAKTQICHDILHENAYGPWKEALVSRGLITAIALPLIGGDKTFGALTIYSGRSDTFTDAEVGLLEELAGDLAFGIIAQRTRTEHEQHTVLMRQSLEQSIQAIAATLESRDPYTAGHQRRVAELSVAIATEMALSEEQIEGIRFAAMIHDLGKIHIPAEILSKPSRLTDIEYLMIQTHPQEGYNILKDIQFPWPIAQIILQHHERLDGSGYPRGLSGDQILLEARIICVADVVEAMSSHRPYRPGLGIEPALEEIRHGRGTIYDPAVVNACMKLFGEQKYRFNDSS